MLHSLIKVESTPAPGSSTMPASRRVEFSLARPAKAVSHTHPSVPVKEASVVEEEVPQEASTLAFDASDLERSRPVTPEAVDDNNHNNNNSNGSSPRRSGDLGTDDEADGVEALQSIWDPPKNKYRLATVSLINFANGLNDSAAGALLPYIERHYGIGYAVVSLIFVGTAFGSIFAAMIVDLVKRRLGRAGTLIVAQLIMAVGYVPMLTMAAPFVAIVFGFFAVGLGQALNLAMGNTFCGSLRQSTVALGAMHGSYGIGGITGPLLATAIAVASGAARTENPNTTASSFARYYFVPFGLTLLTACAAAWSFAGYERDNPADRGDIELIDAQQMTISERLAHRRRQLLRPSPKSASSSPTSPRPPLPVSQPATVASSRPASPSPSPDGVRPGITPLQTTTPMDSFTSASPFFVNNNNSNSNNKRSRTRRCRPPTARLYDAFTTPSSRVVLLGALFLFAYQGSEVAIAGWVTSFLIADRGGTEPAVGYVTAGFWGGITVGRFLLAAPAHRLGERRFVYGSIVVAGVFELLVWFVPNIVGNAVAVAIVGLLLGPVYPCAAAVLMRGLSRRERVTGIGIMAAFGSAGGAAAPFVTGVLAQVAGTFVLHPIALALFAMMLVFWYLVPSTKKPTE